MATKEELKAKFATGMKPTGEDFAELIDGVKGPKGDPGDSIKGDPGPPGKDAEPQFTPEEVAALKALIEPEEE